MTNINHYKILLILPAYLIIGWHQSEASWLIERAAFHMSAHGQTSCLDCHDDVVDRDIHPDPDHVDKSIEDFFKPDQCYACHDDIQDALGQSIHGSQKIRTPLDYSNCIECHDPHKEPPSEIKVIMADPHQSIAKRCSACHEKQEVLPPLGEEEEACMTCHGATRKNATSVEADHTFLCLHCHGKQGTPAQQITGKRLPLMDPDHDSQSSHAGMDCTACHSNALKFEHHRQERIECRACHWPHDEKVAHDAHMSIPCEACHLQGVTPVRDPESRRIGWTWNRDLKHELGVHQMAWPEGHKAQCLRCHYSDNDLGAPSAVLPPKSIACMPCHAATLSLSDPLSIIGVVILLSGLLLSISLWLTAALPGKPRANGTTKIWTLGAQAVRTLFSCQMVSVISVLFYDVLLQRRLFRQSRARWFVHGLIFYPCLFRFLWGLIVLFFSQLRPQWSFIWVMVDKNHPITAAFFDISGVLLFAGIILAFIRGRLNRPNLKGIPAQDVIALGLLAAIVIVGFFLEGMRMAMGELSESGFHAPIGYFISKLFSDPTRLIDTYGPVWYAHAAFTAAFIAYLPFSRLRHIIMAPLMLAVGAVPTYKEKKSEHV